MSSETKTESPIVGGTWDGYLAREIARFSPYGFTGRLLREVKDARRELAEIEASARHEREILTEAWDARDEARAQVATLTQEVAAVENARDHAQEGEAAARADVERLTKERDDARRSLVETEINTTARVTREWHNALSEMRFERDTARKDAEAARAERDRARDAEQVARVEAASHNDPSIGATCMTCGKVPGWSCRKHFVRDLAERDATIRDLAATATDASRRVCQLLDEVRALNGKLQNMREVAMANALRRTR